MKIMISFQVDTAEEAQAVIAAVAAVGKAPHACSKQYVDPSTELSDRRVMHGRRAGEVEETEVLSPAANEIIAKASRANVSPGIPTITKIGTDTKTELLLLIRNEIYPPKKWVEHAKLLWERGYIKYDGKDYYI